jgi:3-deoxy-D-manno-octulosonate 8-phosphate phosphatase (KDO 8-P phosphatase)
MSEPDPVLCERAARIRLLVLDVDGVLTDGGIHYTSAGEEMKSFSILDGLGIKLARRAGIEVAIITGRTSPMVQRRAAELGITHCVQGREDKLAALHELLGALGLTLAETAYMGDDLPDLSAILAAGLGLTVANAGADVVARACWRSSARGGHGAVREACEMLLRARGQWDSLVAAYLGQPRTPS